MSDQSARPPGSLGDRPPPAAATDDEIIIADDDKAVLDLLAAAFKRDYKVHLAKDGKVALDLLERTHPVCVLVDEMMPGATGTEVLQAVKTRHPRATRVLMTASADPERAVQAVNFGEIHRFYTKPLRVTDIRKEILYLVDRAKSEEILRMELETLARIREEETASARIARVVVLGPAGTHLDRVVEASKLRGYNVAAETRHEHMAELVMKRVPDLVILVRGPELNVKIFTRLAHTVDESTAVVVVDGDPTVGAAVEAMEAGASDYLAEPLPELPQMMSRLERAVSRPRAQRDLRRLTRDLVVANRELALSRKKIEQEQVKVLTAIIRMLEARDSYTAGHTDRVSAIAVRTGQQLSLDAPTIERIRVGALLHDIGKLGIRDSVLLKPGKLDPEEFEVIKQHTTIGWELLKDVEQFKCVAQYARNHHEKMDGTGYPDGLKGTDIPLEVRIVSVADVMDAITSTRPYRRGSDVKTAFEIMAHMQPNHLDPMVIDAVQKLHVQGGLMDLLQPGGSEGEGPGPTW
jgi:putative nucleotidyltransferase with HDIG domain